MARESLGARVAMCHGATVALSMAATACPLQVVTATFKLAVILIRVNLNVKLNLKMPATTASEMTAGQ